MSESAKGILAIAAASVIWGLSPLYYKLLSQVPPLEVLSHRTLWSLILFGAILTVQGRLSEVFALLRAHLPMVALAAVMISANWFVFILSVQIGRAVEASLGYFIFPLVAVSIGMLFFGERLSRWQGLAVALAVLAVGLLTWGLGVAPWISLIIACSFGLYGLVKKRMAAGPVVSVTGEVLILAPLAAIWLFGLHDGPWADMGRKGAWFGTDAWTSALLMLSGVLTAGPLVLFSYGARRTRMATLGLVQYLNPTLQFFCAVAILGEPFTRWHMAAFALIWAGLSIFTADSLAAERRRRGQAKAASSLSPSVATFPTVSK